MGLLLVKLLAIQLYFCICGTVEMLCHAVKYSILCVNGLNWDMSPGHSAV